MWPLVKGRILLHVQFKVLKTEERVTFLSQSARILFCWSSVHTRGILRYIFWDTPFSVVAKYLRIDEAGQIKPFCSEVRHRELLLYLPVIFYARYDESLPFVHEGFYMPLNPFWPYLNSQSCLW